MARLDREAVFAALVAGNAAAACATKRLQRIGARGHHVVAVGGTAGCEMVLTMGCTSATCGSSVPAPFVGLSWPALFLRGAVSSQRARQEKAPAMPAQRRPLTGGEFNAAVTSALVGIHQKHLGRGPKTASTFHKNNVVVTLMHERPPRRRSRSVTAATRSCRCATSSRRRWRPTTPKPSSGSRARRGLPSSGTEMLGFG